MPDQKVVNSIGRSLSDVRHAGETECCEGSQREFCWLALAHGYVIGKQGTTLFDTEAMAKTTDIFIDYCLDHPTEKALAAFERSGKSSEKAK